MNRRSLIALLTAPLFAPLLRLLPSEREYHFNEQLRAHVGGYKVQLDEFVEWCQKCKSAESAFWTAAREVEAGKPGSSDRLMRSAEDLLSTSSSTPRVPYRPRGRARMKKRSAQEVHRL
jgi:hypothetical protein